MPPLCTRYLGRLRKNASDLILPEFPVRMTACSYTEKCHPTRLRWRATSRPSLIDCAEQRRFRKAETCLAHLRRNCSPGLPPRELWKGGRARKAATAWREQPTTFFSAKLWSCLRNLARFPIARLASIGASRTTRVVRFTIPSLDWPKKGSGSSLRPACLSFPPIDSLRDSTILYRNVDRPWANGCR